MSSSLHTNIMLLSPPQALFLGPKRINQFWLSTSSQLQKGDISFFLLSQKCNIKLSARLKFTSCGMIPFATTGSSQVNDKEQVQLTSGYFSLSDFQRQLDDLFGEVKTMILRGKESDAIDLLQANYEAVKVQLHTGTRGIEEAAILDVIALGYMALGNIRTVGSLLDELNEIISDLNDEEPLLDSILMHMGSMYAKLEKFEGSVRLYGRAVQIMERECGNNISSLVIPLLGLAKALDSIGKATKAIENYHRVVKILESVKGGESEELAVPLLALGNLLIKGGKAADAENSFKRVLNIYMKLYGEKDGRVGMAMSSLAHAKCAKGDVDEAIDLYKKAVRVIEESNYLALDDKLMEKMRIDLAEILHVVGRGEEGRALLEKCLFISEKYRGKEHPNSVTHLINLATSYSRFKNYGEAERLLRMCLRIMMKTVQPDDQSISFPMLHLAVTLYNLNRDEEAEELALEVVRIRESAFGKDSIPVGEALDCLLSIQTRLGKDDSTLLQQLKRLLKIQESAFGHDSEEITETLKKIVYYLHKMGKKDEIFPLKRRLSMLRKKYNDAVKY